MFQSCTFCVLYLYGQLTAFVLLQMFGSVRQLVRLTPAVSTVSTGVRSHLSTSARRMGGGHGWSYRTTPYPCDPINAKAGTAIMTFTWWWIFHGQYQ